MPQSDFAARLARIEAKKPEPLAAFEPAPEVADVPFDAISGADTVPEDLAPAAKGGGIGRALAWIGLLIGLGAMGAAGAVFVTNGTAGSGPAGIAAGGDRVSDPIVAAGALAPPQTGPAWWEGDAGLTALFGPEMNGSRNVVAYKRIAVSDLPGGSPAGDLDAFAQERGPTLFEGYCGEMRQTLAADCGDGTYRADLILDGRYVEIAATFPFAPSLWTGTGQQVPAGRIHKGELDLTSNGDLPDMPASREEIYARAVSLCGGLRARYGNCAIEAIRIEPAGSAESPGIAARASVHVYAREGELDRDGLRSEIERVTRMRDQALMVLSFL